MLAAVARTSRAMTVYSQSCSKADWYHFIGIADCAGPRLSTAISRFSEKREKPALGQIRRRPGTSESGSAPVPSWPGSSWPPREHLSATGRPGRACPTEKIPVRTRGIISTRTSPANQRRGHRQQSGRPGGIGRGQHPVQHLHRAVDMPRPQQACEIGIARQRRFVQRLVFRVDVARHHRVTQGDPP